MTKPPLRPLPPTRRGACPALSRPMETGDGLLVRLVPADGTLSLAQMDGLAAAARAFGNGLLEVSARGSLQLRGLRPETVAPLNDAVAALAIVPHEGVPMDLSPLSGRDPTEIADARALAAQLRQRLDAAGLPARLGPKVSVVLDGGGAIDLDALSADVRLRACRGPSGVLWEVALAGDARTARPVARLRAPEALQAATDWLARLAALGPSARMGDVLDGAAPPAPLPASDPENRIAASIRASALTSSVPEDSLAATIPGSPLAATIPGSPLAATIPGSPLAATIPGSPLPNPPPHAGEGAGRGQAGPPAFHTEMAAGTGAPLPASPPPQSPAPLAAERAGREQAASPALATDTVASMAAPLPAPPPPQSPAPLVGEGRQPAASLALTTDTAASMAAPLPAPLPPQGLAPLAGEGAEREQAGSPTDTVAGIAAPLPMSSPPQAPAPRANEGARHAASPAVPPYMAVPPRGSTSSLSPAPHAGEGREGREQAASSTLIVEMAAGAATPRPECAQPESPLPHAGEDGDGARRGTEDAGSAPSSAATPSAPRSTSTPTAAPRPPIGRFPLADGSHVQGFGVPFGQMEADTLTAFVAAAAQAGARDLRPAPGRVLLACGLSADGAERLTAAAESLGFLTRPEDPRAFLAVCPGAPACRSAHVAARAMAGEVAEALAPLLDGSVTAHLSACAKGCAHPAPAVLTFVGMDAGIGLVREGSAGAAPEVVLAPEAFLPALAALARVVQETRHPAEEARAALARCGARFTQTVGPEQKMLLEPHSS